MRIAGRRLRAFDLVAIGVVGAFVAIEIVGPATAPQPRRPVDTITHVDVTVDDSGLHIAPTTVPAGLVELTVADHRKDTRPAVQLSSVPKAVSMGPGTQLFTLRVLRNYELAATWGTRRMSAALTIVVPTLAPSTEVRPDRLSLTLHRHSIMASRRDVRLEQPVEPGFEEPPASRPWTAVAAGPISVVIRNESGARQSCVLGGDISVASGHTGTLKVTLPAGTSARYAFLTCYGLGTAQYFDIWTG
jgi:hypothetical protein